jgi:branched-chain amino acid transport system substrate-binding protein
MASTVNMAQGYEHKRFKAPSLANMHNAIQYQLEVPTARNRAFVTLSTISSAGSRPA